MRVAGFLIMVAAATPMAAQSSLASSSVDARATDAAADGYLFLEVGYRVVGDLGDWRVRMGDVPLELRSATWENAPPLLHARGAVLRVGFGAFSPTK